MCTAAHDLTVGDNVTGRSIGNMCATRGYAIAARCEFDDFVSFGG